MPDRGSAGEPGLLRLHALERALQDFAQQYPQLAADIYAAADVHTNISGLQKVPPADTPVRVVFGGLSMTRREVEVIACVARGRSNKEIARELWLSESTVKFHLSNIYRKAGLSSRAQLVAWADAALFQIMSAEYSDGKRDG